MRKRKLEVLPLLGLLSAGFPTIVLSGCAMPPSISILGSYFPDWLFCILAGLLLTFTARAILNHTRNERLLGAPVIAYPSLFVLSSLMVWLLFF